MRRQVKRRATAIILNRQLCKAFQDQLTNKHMPANTCRELAEKIRRFAAKFPQALDIVAWQILGPAMPCCSDDSDTHSPSGCSDDSDTHSPSGCTVAATHSCTDCVLVRCHVPRDNVLENDQPALMANRKSACGCQSTADSKFLYCSCRHQSKISELLLPILLETRVG